MLDGFCDELLDAGIGNGDFRRQGVDGASVLDSLEESHLVGHFVGVGCAECARCW